MPPSSERPSNEYWRSLNELADAPEFRRFVEAEFPSPLDDGGMTRRRWLQAIGVSLAAAGVGGCRWEREEILSFDQRPDGRVPGKPQQFATAMELGGPGVGLVVTSFDGRPIKVEGNPKHPGSLGAADAFAQAAIFEIYDPDRSQSIVRTSGSQEVTAQWSDFATFAREHFGRLRQAGGKGLYILSEASGSPTRAGMRTRLEEAMPEAKWFEYEPLAPARATASVHYDLTKADVIVCLDADLLSAFPGSLEYARRFAERRHPEAGRLNRLYVVESCPSCTGATADHRLPLASSRVAGFAVELARQAASISDDEVESLVLLPWWLARRAEEFARAKLTHGGRIQRFLAAVAEDLLAHQGRCLVAAGPSQPPEVHAIVRRINAALGNVGETVRYFDRPARPPDVEAIRTLAERMHVGEVDTLVILGGNPVYNAPVDLDFPAALGKVKTSVHLGLYRDETATACQWHVPRAHWLESWGDVRSQDGTYSVVQPLIAPLYEGRSAIELVATILGDESADAAKLVRATFAKIAGDRQSEDLWRRTLHDGLLPESRFEAVDPDLTAEDSGQPRARGRETAAQQAEGEMEIVFRCDPSVYDGRFANNGWLQEMPDPITRLTWGNAALVSPATAVERDIEDGSLAKLAYKGRELEIPVLVLPGVAADTVVVSLGYGRTAAGHGGGLVADGVEPVGANAYLLRTSEAMHFDTGARLEPTGRKVALATTQDHHAIDALGLKTRDKRAGVLIQVASLDRFKEYQELSPDEREEEDLAGHHVHHPPLVSLWKEHEYPGFRWGMSIDLSKCIGCGACVVACQAENNVAVVGKERVLEGRQMHWIRVDRYFRGDPEDPEIATLPVLCQQCETAPCEQVCPVAATVHSSEGLNEMVYNRCVGTRYCANNCPYKVRRFNYFAYHRELERPAGEVAKMKFNPEVTVRSRGVMEKCTFCVQRIQAAKIDAKNRREAVRDGEVKTACQQACPSEAIQFGDLNDRQSKVYEAHASVRAYAILAELNTKPRVAYLARIRNPNPQLSGDGHEHEG